MGLDVPIQQIKPKDLNEKSFREQYVSVLSEGVAMKCGVSQDKVEVWPLDIDGDWGRRYEGFHALRDYVLGRIKGEGAYDDMAVNADALFEVLEKGTVFESVIQPNVKADETYGDFELSAFGRGSTDGKTSMKLAKIVKRTLGEQYRIADVTAHASTTVCDKTLSSTSRNASTVPMKPSARTPKTHPRRVIDRVDELNFLDYELWAFANNLFDERMVRLKNSPTVFPRSRACAFGGFAHRSSADTRHTH